MWYCWQHGWLSVAFAFGADMIYIYATFQPRYTSKSFWKEKKKFFQNCPFKFSTPPNTLSSKWAFQNSTLQALHSPRRLHLVQVIFLLSVAIWKKTGGEVEVGGARDGEQLYLYLYLVHKLGFSKVDISHYRHYQRWCTFSSWCLL